jgi:3D (Asp-Asp-Asp) domain-containing protein
MKRGTFEALFISALAYTVIASAAMPTRAQETVIYPVKPLEERNVDSLVDKARRAIYTQIRALAQEERIGRTDNDATDGDNPTAYEDSEYAGEDFDSGIVAEPAGADDYSGGMEEAEGYDGGDTADPVLTCLGDWTISFYCPCEICCGQWATGCTASGVLATPWHTVATDGLEFGTVLYVDGLGYFTVEDRGTEYGWLDIYVGDHAAALDLGLQTRSVYIVSEG